jgi:hypothetical protein
MIYLMLALPYVLVDLVGKERRQINAAIDSAVAGDPLSKFAYAYLRRSLNIPLPSDLHGRVQADCRLKILTMS